MKKAAIFTSDFFQKNKLFDKESRDDCLHHMYLLRKKWKREGYELNTQDIYPLEDCEFVLFMYFPIFQIDILEKLTNLNKDLYLICYESEMISPNDWKKSNHKHFKKIFTWSDKLVDDKKYIKFYNPNRVPKNLDFSLKKKDKFCTLIAGNKSHFDRRELYSERNKAILWFEKKHLNKFDLYGVGWEKGIWKPFIRPYLHSKIFRLANRITDKLKISRRLFRKKLKSYKGKVESKKETYSRYKFAICYENVKNIDGYITEKIFDCFFTGCVPIYLGAPDVANFIPKNTFIDKNRFKTYRKLFIFLKNMDNELYSQYLENIKAFLKSEKMFYFSDENFVNTLTNNILRN